MRLLHTSDWHLGRTLHRADLRDAQAAFLDGLVATVREERVDAVLVAGDVYDRAVPSVDAVALYDDALVRLREGGARVVVTSGNHDSASRLGVGARLVDAAGVHVRTRPQSVAEPVLLDDVHGPAAVRDLLPGGAEPAEPADPSPGRGAHTRVLTRALAAVAADRAVRGGRAVALAHAWVTGGQASDSERDIAVGGVGHVPAGLFDGLDYTALGHLHRPQVLREGLRYSGSPLPYSFGEAAADKLSWLVELGPAGLSCVQAVPAPVFRRLTALSGTLDELLTSSAHTPYERDFVALTVTDPVRPVDAMAALQRRYAFPLTLVWQPASLPSGDGASYAQRTRGRSDLEVADAFVRHVRGAASEAERALLGAALDAARLTEDAA